MRSRLIAGILMLTAGCGGGGSSSPAEPACVVLGQGSSQALVQGDGLQVELEVRFLQVSDSLLQGLGVDFRAVLAPEPEAAPPFGGKFVERATYVAGQDVVGHLPGGNVIVPQGHRAGSYLPNGHASNPPGLGAAAAFFQAPGADDQCLDVAVAVRALALAPNGVPAATAIVPNGSLPAGQGVAATGLSPQQVAALLQAIANDPTAAAISAPTVRVYDRQQLIVVSSSEQAPPTDLLDIVQSEVLGGRSFTHVTSGPTLDVRPVLEPNGLSIRLEIRPLSTGAVAVMSEPVVVGALPLVAQVPVLVPTTVRTNVILPDGATVLLGGLKNVADDGASGLPLLSRLPYVNRLFKATSTMNEVPSLMIMVTPRIVND